MLFSRDWLAQYVDLPADNEQLAERLTFAGLAVEYVEEKDGDVVFDVDVTTNRPDCMNHFGLAREIAVLFEQPLKPPPHVPLLGVGAPAAPSGEVAKTIPVRLDNDHCPRYAAMVIRGVRVGPSPDWLRRRLASIGARPINNVVDVTNYVLWELGQPLHAFDLAKLAGAEIVVRAAREGEELVTLDGERRPLDPDLLVIADRERPVALAGVMGGLDSEVTGTTVDVLLESAHFDPRAVRRGARKLAIHTDASHRFERGSDPEICAVAATRAAHLIAEVAGGEVAEGIADAARDPGRSWRLEGRLEKARLDRFMGVATEPSHVERWLGGLGLELSPLPGGGGWNVSAPGWRYYDFERRKPDGSIYEADLFEEVVRLHGYAAVPPTTPRLPGLDALPTPVQVARRRIQDHLAACGFAEAINFAFHSPAEAEAAPAIGRQAPAGEGQATAAQPAQSTVLLANALSDRYSALRRSLLPGLIESATFNQRRNAESVALFEVGNTFLPPAADSPGVLLHEVEAVGLIWGGAGSQGSAWEPRAAIDFFDLKGVLESLVAALAPALRLEARPATLPGLTPGATAELRLRAGEPRSSDGEGHSGRVVGYAGQVDGEGPYPLFAAELRLDALLPSDEVAAIEAPSRYPGVDVDLTLTHARTITWAALASAIRSASPPELRGFGLKDRYSGPGVPEGAVNTTISFSYNADDRSLTHEEVNERHRALSDELAKRFGIERETETS